MSSTRHDPEGDFQGCGWRYINPAVFRTDEEEALSVAEEQLLCDAETLEAVQPDMSVMTAPVTTEAQDSASLPDREYVLHHLNVARQALAAIDSQHQ